MTIDELIALVNVQTTPTPNGQTLVDVQAPPEVWAMLETMAKREGTTAHEIMGDLVRQSLLRAIRLADEGGLPDATD